MVSLVARASLCIHLTHYAIFPMLLEHLPPALVIVLSIAVRQGAPAIRTDFVASPQRPLVSFTSTNSALAEG